MIERAFIFSLVVITAHVLTYAQESRLKLEERRVTIQMTQKPLFTVFARLTVDYDIPIGLEESVLDIDHRHYDFETARPPEWWITKYARREHKSAAPVFSEHLITVNFVEAKLKDVMNEIVKQMKNYDWEIRDEVVNIFPIRGRDERLKKLMEIEISFFYVGAGAKTSAIQAQLVLFLPEFRKFLKENNLLSDTTRSAPGFPDELVASEMLFKNLSFRDLLNAITKSKRGGWIVRMKKDPSEPAKHSVNIQVD